MEWAFQGHTGGRDQLVGRRPKLERSMSEIGGEIGETIAVVE